MHCKGRLSGRWLVAGRLIAGRGRNLPDPGGHKLPACATRGGRAHMAIDEGLPRTGQPLLSYMDGVDTAYAPLRRCFSEC
jgi:hypothetical protein